MIVIYINCALFPFVSWILSGLKTYETRNRNTLKQFIGKTVYIAETGRNRPPVVRCACTISELVTVTDKAAYESFRAACMIEQGSKYDYTSTTKKKCLYKLENIRAVSPFVPHGIRHGYTWLEIV